MHTKPLMQHQIIFYKTAFIYQRELEGLRKKKKEKKENNHSLRGQTTPLLETVRARWFKFNPS